jgi:tetratricopeptide (TPR) repeat protein
MTQQHLNAAHEALVPYVQGTTLELGLAAPQFPGATLVDRGGEAGASVYTTLPGIEPASVDAIVSVDGPRYINDLVAALHTWRRALRPGGTLAIACSNAPARDTLHRWTASAFVSIAQIAGGFQVDSIEELHSGEGGFVIIAKRSAPASIRGPLGLLGPEIASVCLESPDLLSEVHFHFGTILLQAGDAAGASTHFAQVLEYEPQSFEGLFGLGMSLARVGRWQESIVHLQQCAALQPDNRAVTAWVQLAIERARSVPAGNPAAAITPQASTYTATPQPSQAGLPSGFVHNPVGTPAT